MKASTARWELDAKIVEIELTLVSIIQGVALNFLIDSTRQLATPQKILFWPYILAGLLIIFVFWSRSVLHIITVIRWPIEFGHNFLYIACALAESLLFMRLAQPDSWFVFAACFTALGWILFVYDLRLIRSRRRDCAGPGGAELCALVENDQRRNIALVLPAVFILNLAFALAVHNWPDLFLVRHGHVWLVAAQVVGFAGYLFYVVRFYARIAPLIVQARAEWKAAGIEEEHQA